MGSNLQNCFTPIASSVVILSVLISGTILEAAPVYTISDLSATATGTASPVNNRALFHNWDQKLKEDWVLLTVVLSVWTSFIFIFWVSIAKLRQYCSCCSVERLRSREYEADDVDALLHQDLTRGRSPITSGNEDCNESENGEEDQDLHAPYD